MKWRQFVYLRKSEDRFLNRIETIFGSNIVLVYSDWSRKSQMKHFMSTMNVGLIEKKYETISINKYNTSKLCCECNNRLEYEKRTFRHLSCKNCLSSENKNKVVYRTKVANLEINIMKLFHNWCLHKERPELFKLSYLLIYLKFNPKYIILNLL